MATPPNTAWQTLIGAGYGPEVVTQLRALGPQQLQELVTQGSSSSSAGVVAVQAAWLLCTRHPPGSCPDSTGLVDLTTSPSHAVGVRALTALLKCDSARLVQVVPQTSSALRTVAFQALARLGHGSLRGLVTPELLASCERHIAAKLLLKGSTEDQAALAKAQWPGLASSASFKAAFSLAARMPLLVLQLLSSTIPKHWQKQQVAQVVSVAVASSPDAAMTILGELADLPKAFFSKGFAICLLKGLAKKQPAETLQEFRRWLPADVKVRLGDATPWGELLTSCAQRAARRGQNLWHVAIELATELARLDSLAAPALFNALKLPKGMALSHEQLRSLFGITDLGHLGPLLCPLRRSTAEATLDAALCQKLSETKDVSSARGEVHSLAQWTPQARKRLAKRLATPKPEEVAGAPPSEDYLEILSWLPEEVEEVKSLCNSSNGQAREAGFKALIRNAARETPRTSEAIEEALHFFERRLKNEQDNIRAEVLQHMQDVVPLRSWSPSHVEPLRRLLMFSMQAKGSSALSLQVWANVLEVLLAHGVAMASTNEMNACGALGLEILEQLQGAAVCSKEILANMHFGTKVFERLARLEDQEKSAAFGTHGLDWLVLRFLRPGIEDLLKKGQVQVAGQWLVRWDTTSLTLEKARRGRGSESMISPALRSLLREGFKAVRDAMGSWFTSSRKMQELIQECLQWDLEVTATERTACQVEALQFLCQMCMKSSLMRVIDWTLCTQTPWHVGYAFQFLAGHRGLWLHKHDPQLHNELVRALCCSWQWMNERQRYAFVHHVVRVGKGCCGFGLRSLVECLWTWHFRLDVEQFTAQKIRLRGSLENCLPKKRQKKVIVQSLMEHWARAPLEVRLDLLCTSSLLMRRLQYKAESMEMLLPSGPCSSKLYHFRSLIMDSIPLHFFDRFSADQSCPPFFAWSQRLQTAFADFWLLPNLTEQSVGLSLRPGQNEKIFVRCAQLLLALPHVDPKPLDSFVNFCASTQGQQGSSGTAELSTEQAFLRGSCGALLDQLVLVMAACDQPKSILSTFQRQLGKGVSKQVARSFVRLLGRMGGREASELVLRTTTGQAFLGLKVAEQVAMVRLMGKFLGESAVEPLKSIWQNKCHRDVGGAVLTQLCHRKVSSKASAELLKDAFIGAKEGREEVLYPVQVTLRNLCGSPCDDMVAELLLPLCSLDTLMEFTFGAFAAWAKSRQGPDQVLAARVAAAITDALCRNPPASVPVHTDRATIAATRCLVDLATLDPSYLKAALSRLSETAARPCRLAHRRLDIMVQELRRSPQASLAATTLLEGNACAVNRGLMPWAFHLSWEDGKKLLEELSQLPAAVVQEPLYFKQMVRCCVESLKSRNATEEELEQTARILAGSEVGRWADARLVMLIAMAQCTSRAYESLEAALTTAGPLSKAVQLILTDDYFSLLVPGSGQEVQDNEDDFCDDDEEEEEIETV